MTSTSVLAACASRTGKVYGSGLHADVCLALIAELTVLRQSMLERENTMATQLKLLQAVPENTEIRVSKSDSPQVLTVTASSAAAV